MANSWQAVNGTKEQAYTPTFTGFGTVSAVNFTWTRVGNRLKVMGKFTSGTSTGVEGRITLPAGLASDAALVPSIMVCGIIALSVAAGAAYYCLIESAAAYITIGAQSGTTASLAKRLASEVLASGNSATVQFEIPISGWND